MKRQLRKKRFGLASKIALVTTLSLAFAMLSVTAVQLWLFRKNQEEAVFANQHRLTASIADNLDQQLVTLKNALISSARAVTEEDLVSSDAAQKYLDNNAGLNAIFERSVFLFSPEGKLIAERPFLPNRRGQDFKWRDYNREALRTRGPVISEPFVTTKDDHNAVIMFATPVFSKDGQRIIATNTGSFGLTHPQLLGNIARMKIGKTGFMYLVTHEGKLVMHPERQTLLRRAYPPGTNPLFERALAGFEGTGRSLERDGRSAIVTFKRIPTTGWLLATVFPEDEAFASFDELVRNLLIIFGASVLCASALVWFLSSSLVSKIQSKNEILKQLKSESLSQLKTKTQFFNEASHDFRQRLHGMQLLVNAAERNDAQGGGAATLPKLKSALADLQRYLNNFLEITRLETIQVQPTATRVVMQNVFQDLELQFEEAAEERLVNLKFRVSPLVVHTDEKVLFRILENLISNAIKYSRGKVLVAARRRQGFDEILVIDNGEGFPEADRAQIFSAFVQGRNSRLSGANDAGFGLGLSIVMRSANLLNATVRLNSAPGRGSIVRIALPSRSIPGDALHPDSGPDTLTP